MVTPLPAVAATTTTSPISSAPAAVPSVPAAVPDYGAAALEFAQFQEFQRQRLNPAFWASLARESAPAFTAPSPGFAAAPTAAPAAAPVAVQSIDCLPLRGSGLQPEPLSL